MNYKPKNSVFIYKSLNMFVKMLYWEKKESILVALDLLRKGEVLIGDSDTVPGLLAPFSLEGKQALDALKGRSAKPYILLIESWERLYQLTNAQENPALINLLGAAWPGPLTVILKASSQAPEWAVAPQGTLAVRMPEHAGLLSLLKKSGPLFSTSANLTGEPVPSNIKSVTPMLCNKVPLALINYTTSINSVLPSTLVDCTQTPFKIVRQGRYNSCLLTCLSTEK